MMMNPGNKVTYNLTESGESGISGTVTVEEREDNSSKVTVQLTGTSAGESHPNHFHMNSALEGGDVSITLTPIDGETGMGVTSVTSMDDGTAVSYTELLEYDGHLRVHKSENEMTNIVTLGDIGGNVLTGEMEMAPIEGEGIEGNIKFEERQSGATMVTVTVTGAPTSSDHPNHIHANTAVEGGSIEISLSDIDGTSGIGKTHVEAKDDGTGITYDQLLEFDGYAVVHLSSSDFSPIAIGDIGQNELTGMTDKFRLSEDAIDLVEGEVEIFERKNGETLAVLELAGPHGTEDHPAHIHSNSLAEGGSIAISFNDVVDGVSETNIAQLDDGTSITFTELKEFDGYVRVHASSSNMGTTVASGDFGQNALTGEEMEYDIRAANSFSIEGSATVFQRRSGASLLSINLGGDGDHPSHIHENTNVEGGGIIITLNNVTGGKADTHIEADDTGNPVTFDQLLELNGHIKIHNSAGDFSVIANADIGQNAFTGEVVEYGIDAVNASGVTGLAVIEERKNGTALITMEIDGATPGGEHPNHIHENTLLEGGGVIIALTNIDGDTGRGETQVSSLDDGTALTYEELINIDGHFKIHNNPADFTVVADGEAGGNVFTGESTVYEILELNSSGVSGTATFAERKNGSTLITLELDGTFGEGHPNHIHQNSANDGGPVLITLTNVDGNTGMGTTQVSQNDAGNAITYTELLNLNGHIRVHNSSVDFSSIAEGNIGSNVN
jgi:hypothetical protein